MVRTIGIERENCGILEGDWGMVRQNYEMTTKVENDSASDF